MSEGIFILDIDQDGVVAVHPRRVELPALVAPIPQKDRATKFNTLRPPLIVVGCMTVPNRGFEFDSSFPNPNSEKKFTRFAELMRKLRNQDKPSFRFPPVSIFGHTDPTGRDAYNKTLSGRRGRSIYGLLTRDVKIWDDLFLRRDGAEGDKWGLRSIRFMLSKIKDTRVQPPVPFFIGDPDGKEKDIDARTRAAVKEFEDARGLKGGSIGTLPSTATRHAMYLEYMDLICHDQQGKRFSLDPKEHFIAKQKDKVGLRGDVQGCSEFNPIFLLTKQEEEELSKSEELKEIRNEKYAKDRRVIIYIFKHETEIDLDTWPCPESRTGAKLCEKRFWSDSKIRLERRDEERNFKDNRDTMACRFYHGFAEMSPCETEGGRLWIIRFRIDGDKDEPIPLRFRRYVLKAGSTEFAPIIRGTLTEKGELRIPVFDERVLMTLKLDAFGQEFHFNDEDPPVGDQPSATPAAGSNGEPAAKENVGDSKDGDPNSGFDTDKFEDEDTFLEIKLDAGVLQPVSDTEDLPFKQRLYNLGFGKNPPDQWTKEELDAAVRAYRHRRPQLGEGSDLNKPTRDLIQKEHELEDVPPPPEDDESPEPVTAAQPTGAS